MPAQTAVAGGKRPARGGGVADPAAQGIAPPRRRCPPMQRGGHRLAQPARPAQPARRIDGAFSPAGTGSRARANAMCRAAGLEDAARWATPAPRIPWRRAASRCAAGGRAFGQGANRRGMRPRFSGMAALAPGRVGRDVRNCRTTECASAPDGPCTGSRRNALRTTPARADPAHAALPKKPPAPPALRDRPGAIGMEFDGAAKRECQGA